jgi:hypothetical protein
MAGGRRIPIRGSIRSLSPTDGKFRVKGNGTHRQFESYFCTGMRLKSIKAGDSAAAGYIPADSRIFSLGRTIVIIDNASP